VTLSCAIVNNGKSISHISGYLQPAVAPHHLVAPLGGGYRDAGHLRIPTPCPRRGLHRCRLAAAPVRRRAKAAATKCVSPTEATKSRSLYQLNPMVLVEVKHGSKSTSTVGGHHLFLVVSMASSRPSTRARSTGASTWSLPPAPATSPRRAFAASSSVAVVVVGACGSTAAEGVDAACFDWCGSTCMDGPGRCPCPGAARAEVERAGKAGRSPSSGAGREVLLHGSGGVPATRCRCAEVESFGGVCLTRCKAARAASRVEPGPHATSSRTTLPFPR
jgi:hypothetical protein